VEIRGKWRGKGGRVGRGRKMGGSSESKERKDEKKKE